MSAQPYTPEEIEAFRRSGKVPVRWLATLSAARAEAIEECAEIAQQRANVAGYATHGVDPKVVVARVQTAMCILEEIRALAQKAGV